MARWDNPVHPTPNERLYMDANITAQTPDVNREYKNSVFTMLFDNEAVLIELTNALFGTAYGPDTPVSITTLKNVLSYGLVNDLSYVLDDRLIVLVEHQSTLSDVMPYRMLLYIAETYGRLYDNRLQYQRHRFPLKRPKFIVLYNGDEEMKEDVLILRLSDMFTPYTAESIAADTGLVDLELTVTVYNIKDGRNAHIVKGCKLLREYGIFTDTVRANRINKNMVLNEAMRKAVEDCIAQNILWEFLTKHKQEVIGMLLAEWDLDTALDVRGEERFMEGMEAGMEAGMEKGVLRAARAMKEMGLDICTIAKATELPIDTILNL
jgi:predicted transposase/invertase (TIGR01784 family)